MYRLGGSLWLASSCCICIFNSDLGSITMTTVSTLTKFKNKYTRMVSSDSWTNNRVSWEQLGNIFNTKPVENTIYVIFIIFFKFCQPFAIAHEHFIRKFTWKGYFEEFASQGKLFLRDETLWNYKGLMPRQIRPLKWVMSFPFSGIRTV